MATLWEKISRANDAACAIFRAINRSSIDDGIDNAKRRLFNDLEEARSQISPDLFLKKDTLAPQLVKELGPSIDNERALKAVRYMARVNLATFTIAIWTGSDLRQVLYSFFPYVIPKHYVYDDKLFKTFLAISSWAACTEANIRNEEEGENADMLDILRDYLNPNAESLGMPDMDEELEPLRLMCVEKFNWIMSLEYLDDWQNEVASSNVRNTWTDMCYDIMDKFDQLYPAPNTQVASRSNAKHGDIVEILKEDAVKSNKQSKAENPEESEEENSKEGGSEKEEFEKAEPEEEESEEHEGSEHEEDELDEEEEDTFLTPTESLAPESSSSSTTKDNSKRNVRNDDEMEEGIPKIKRPRVLPATQLSQQSLESLDDIPLPNPQPDENAAPGNAFSTADLQESQQTTPPELHPFYADQALPHGLPRTINEGPASPISDYEDQDKEYDTSFKKAVESTVAEQSISVGSAPKRVRRDLPFSANTQRLSNVERGPRVFSQGGQPSNNERPSRRRYTPWSNEELDALEAGLEMFGPSWSRIKTHFHGILAQRTNVQVKDKARTEYTAREKAGLSLGVYTCITPKFTAEQVHQRSIRTASNKQRRQLEESGEQ